MNINKRSVKKATYNLKYIYHWKEITILKYGRHVYFNIIMTF